jgi:unsaturated rhamnogalacturonyl hydrolase
MKVIICSIVILFSVSLYTLAQERNNSNTITTEVLAANFLKLYPDSIIYKDQVNSKKWNYEQGLILQTFYQLWSVTGKNEYLEYLTKNLDYYVDNNGRIKTYKIEDYNLDNLAAGRVLLDIFELTQNQKYKKAADTLREQLKHQPRTTDRGFWHKKIYPNQMWLDGLFMAEPFYAEYAHLNNDKISFNDVADQFLLIQKHCLDKKTGLYYHGWDESKVQKWANPKSGTSPSFWGRSMGWYMMALVDVLDYFPNSLPQRKSLIRLFQELASNLLKYRDPKSGLWYQVIDQGKREGNFIETSCSLMFVYSFAKGYNKGYLNDKYFNIARTSFNSLQKNFIVEEKGLLNLTNICAGAGLGGNPYRDGSYDYYIHESKRTNDFKGYGPLLLASLEIEKGQTVKYKNRKVGLDYFFNNEYKDHRRYHYIWEDKENSGFSELGKIIQKAGADVDSVTVNPSVDILNNLDVYIIVDPDTPGEAARPNYIDKKADKIISEWVKKGGVLVLLANDSSNCEFEHLNKLAGIFGLHFNQDSENKVIGKNYDSGKFDELPDHPIFESVKKIFIKEITSISVTKSVKPVLKRNGKVFMASVAYGKGFVFAVGDPWLYNEYIDNRKIPNDFENYKAGENLINWLLSKTKKQDNRK